MSPWRHVQRGLDHVGFDLTNELLITRSKTLTGNILVKERVSGGEISNGDPFLSLLCFLVSVKRAALLHPAYLPHHSLLWRTSQPKTETSQTESQIFFLEVSLLGDLSQWGLTVHLTTKPLFPHSKNLVLHRDGSGSFVPEGMCRWMAVAFLLCFPSKEPRKHVGLMLYNGSYYDFLCGEFCEQWDARHLADRNYS